MPQRKPSKTIEDINRKIKQGKVVVVTADEMTEIVWCVPYPNDAAARTTTTPGVG